MKRSIPIIAASLLSVLLLSGFSTSTTGYPIQDREVLQRLTVKALQTLKDEYNVLTTGIRSTGPLLPHQNERGQRRSSDERLSDVLGRRQEAMKAGRPYTKVDIDLQPHGADVVGDKTILHATEDVVRHFTFNRGKRDPERDVTQMRIEHDFVFTTQPQSVSGTASRNPAIVTVAYRPLGGQEQMIIADQLPPPDPYSDPSSAELFPEETVYPNASGPPTSDCSSCPVGTESFSYYDGVAAAQYAYAHGTARNYVYRQFGNDCTNFASQCLLAGGWQMTGGLNWKNWYKWWYSIYGLQTRTWTQARASFFFMGNSGRASINYYIGSTLPGNIIYCDWERDRIIDHAVVVDEVRGPFGFRSVYDIFVSYHTNDTRHRPFNELFFPNGGNNVSDFYDYSPVFNQ